MKSIRIYFTRFLLFVLALQILNLSVCGNEYMQQTIDECGNTVLSKNQIDSFVEYVTEEVVVHKNVFPEQKGSHPKSTGKIIKTPYKIFAPYRTSRYSHESAANMEDYNIYNLPYHPLYYAEIYPKPPNAA